MSFTRDELKWFYVRGFIHGFAEKDGAAPKLDEIAENFDGLYRAWRASRRKGKAFEPTEWDSPLPFDKA
jgi:hypothetical protein